MPNNLLNGTIILYNQLGIVEYECTINSDSIRIETDCKNAVLESMEKMIDGNRTQDDFKQLGNEFLLNYPDANLEDYFEYFGFDIYNPNLHEAIKRSIVDLYKFKKQMYGMSTKTAQRLIKSDNELKTAEGIEKKIDVKYTMKQWVDNMRSYLRSTMSYCNSFSLEQFIGKQILKVQSPSEIYSVNK